MGKFSLPKAVKHSVDECYEETVEVIFQFQFQMKRSLEKIACMFSDTKSERKYPYQLDKEGKSLCIRVAKSKKI